ncbi:MAG: sensor domain-containing diguanylate cyclase [Spirochaetales bacterium]|nr:sensor domain-containing diguanylate cyclase [Spirochaetales bacterium]
MKMLDSHTLSSVFVLISFIAAVTRYILWKDEHVHFKGLGLWFLGSLLEMAGFLIISLRDYPTSAFTDIVSSGLIFAGWLGLLAGLEIFLGKPSVRARHVSTLVTGMIMYTVFTVVWPMQWARNFIFDFMMAFIWGQIALLVLRHEKAGMKNAVQMSGIVFLLFAIQAGARIVWDLIPASSLAGISENAWRVTIPAMTFLVLEILANISLLLMVSRTLLHKYEVEGKKKGILFELAPNGMVTVDLETGKITETNNSFTRILKLDPSEVIGTRFVDLPIWTDTSIPVKILERISNGNMVSSREIECRFSDGNFLNILFSAMPLHHSVNASMVASIEEINELSQMKKKLKEMATHDALTTLPNRRLLYERFITAQGHADRYMHKMALFILDLDNYKQINDRYGHSVGDKLLVQLSKRLMRITRQEDTLVRFNDKDYTIARFGGDEIAILFASIHERQDAERGIERILKVFEEPFSIDGNSIGISGTAGGALYPDDGSTLDELLTKADKAMYERKNNGKNGFALYASA